MINIEKIKRKIALLAISGKLTTQNSSFNAQDLYDDIIAKKKQLNKKFKEMIQLNRDVPFGIPKNWKWCNLSNIVSIVVGATPSTANINYWENGTIYWLPSGCCHDCVVTENNKYIKKITKLGFNHCSASMMTPGTTLLALTGATAGRVGFLTFDACANQSVVGITADFLIEPKFIYYSFYARKNEILGDCVGSAQPHFSKDYVTKMVFPLPPLEEQKRIVDKLDAIFDELDKVENNQSKLIDIQNKLQSKVLKLAIQGKLVEQNPEEGTGQELLKSLGVINNIQEEIDDIPFEIPQSWAWCKLSDIGTTNIGLTYHPEDIVDNGTMVIRSSNIVNGKLDFNEKVCVNCSIKPSQYLNDTDIVICSRNGSKNLVGKNTIYRGVNNHYSFGAFMAVFRTQFYDYVHLYFNSDAFKRYFNSDDSEQINQVTQAILKDSLIPLPPLKEQIRIVEKYNELINVIKSI